MNMIAQTVIRYNEADGYYEVQAGDVCQRYPRREMAIAVAQGYGDDVILERFTPEDSAWARETLQIMNGMRAERGDGRHYVPKNRTRAHLNRIEAVER